MMLAPHHPIPSNDLGADPHRLLTAAATRVPSDGAALDSDVVGEVARLATGLDCINAGDLLTVEDQVLDHDVAGVLDVDGVRRSLADKPRRRAARRTGDDDRLSVLAVHVEDVQRVSVVTCLECQRVARLESGQLALIVARVGGHFRSPGPPAHKPHENHPTERCPLHSMIKNRSAAKVQPTRPPLPQAGRSVPAPAALIFALASYERYRSCKSCHVPGGSTPRGFFRTKKRRPMLAPRRLG